jgi:hypothetical protein
VLLFSLRFRWCWELLYFLLLKVFVLLTMQIYSLWWIQRTIDQFTCPIFDAGIQFHYDLCRNALQQAFPRSNGVCHFCCTFMLSLSSSHPLATACLRWIAATMRRTKASNWSTRRRRRRHQ